MSHDRSTEFLEKAFWKSFRYMLCTMFLVILGSTILAGIAVVQESKRPHAPRRSGAGEPSVTDVLPELLADPAALVALQQAVDGSGAAEDVLARMVDRSKLAAQDQAIMKQCFKQLSYFKDQESFEDCIWAVPQVQDLYMGMCEANFRALAEARAAGGKRITADQLLAEISRSPFAVVAEQVNDEGIYEVAKRAAVVVAQKVIKDDKELKSFMDQVEDLARGVVQQRPGGRGLGF